MAWHKDYPFLFLDSAMFAWSFFLTFFEARQSVDLWPTLPKLKKFPLNFLFGGLSYYFDDFFLFFNLVGSSSIIFALLTAKFPRELILWLYYPLWFLTSQWDLRKASPCICASSSFWSPSTNMVTSRLLHPLKKHHSQPNIQSRLSEYIEHS